MACIGSGRLCARVEKLCQFGHFTQVRRKVSTACVRFRQDIPQSGSTLVQHCQNGARSRVRGVIPGSRAVSSMQTQQPGSLPEFQVDPYRLIDDDLKDVYDDIRLELVRNTSQEELKTIATYYFDGQGKALRPMVAILMARAINYHKERSDLLASQRQVAMIAEMIHSASLIHDDVIDQSDFRRGKPSVNVLWNHKKVTMAGDFILAIASMMIARLRNDDVTLTLSQVVTDLVQGEFMQLGSKETENERFAHYLTKTYRKTASLIANSAKAVAMLAGADDHLADVAFQYGRNVGLAFQLVDDLLDFVSSSAAMGKPTAADLKLGLATAPVLFACERYPELNPMIMRRFQEPGDVEKAFEFVHKSQGLEQTRFLAKKHCVEAARLAQSLAESPYQKGLLVVSDFVINRMK
ncbi:all trans-polyprenyl-diphosphate synthase PDSS1 isoform X1 [Neodiprion pinetum]|uniref:All trans-polyprenyl-diphosphate synthase PDSS1 isoform X1 n=1 Tax=Neodiprion lecontei TaxID=441921 RepID=A0ABM3FG39_NEOLC|nr:all trans-polyprenyl-diphosphate synthase PDSS1 isoform X1 [Neodiprion fabricii]XP_046464827.1 all trans-polyprenyl-diphosphate synthase PDSS1 isoform X1 [Neodiprion pinetum]XP_046586990.1 all trans-polyprenyl-diphosphate synthase PDSS1 isoform X1 [Neodiprion lecontei]XP_046630552.1 all trans-polyprenyl-diphosphate synthase PDSS1 isoform X1 [Neodiprion virginianus]